MYFFMVRGRGDCFFFWSEAFDNKCLSAIRHDIVKDACIICTRTYQRATCITDTNVGLETLRTLRSLASTTLNPSIRTSSASPRFYSWVILNLPISQVLRL